jgi:hypothetical protein
MAELNDPVSGAGVSSDGQGAYDGDHVGGRFRLKPQCADGSGPPAERHMSLQSLPIIAALAGVTIPTCNGEDVSGAGWLHLQLPNLLEDDICGGASSCTPFDDVPSYVIRGGKVKPTGAFGPTAHFFFYGGDHFNFVFQQATVAIKGDGSRTVTATEAHLYTLGDLQTVLWSGPLALDITVTP